eukprot:TCONS_00067060-protein
MLVMVYRDSMMPSLNKKSLTRSHSYDPFCASKSKMVTKETNNFYRKAIRRVSLQMYAELPVESRQSVESILEHVENDHIQQTHSTKSRTSCQQQEQSDKTRNFVLTGFKPIPV